MTDYMLDAGEAENVAAGLAAVVDDFAGEAGGPPSLGELLEVLGWAAPSHSEATDGTFPVPLWFNATLKGNKRYGTTEKSRVAELNDHVFEDARECLGDLVAKLAEAGPGPVGPREFAGGLLQVLRTGRIPLTDVAVEDLRKLTPDVPKKRVPKLAPGDVVAIPAAAGGYHVAVVITANRFGTALGLFAGTSPDGRLGPQLRAAPRERPVYTEESRVKDGTWKVVGHDESLLGLFPADPPIYHKPGAWEGIVDTGEFGAAETADGTMTFLDEDQARAVGLHDGSYRNVSAAAYLQEQLDQEG